MSNSTSEQVSINMESIKETSSPQDIIEIQTNSTKQEPLDSDNRERVRDTSKIKEDENKIEIFEPETVDEKEVANEKDNRERVRDTSKIKEDENKIEIFEPETVDKKEVAKLTSEIIGDHSMHKTGRKARKQPPADGTLPFSKRPVLVYNMMQAQSQPVGEPLYYDQSRNKFVRKVFTIIAVMLSITVIGVSICYVMKFSILSSKIGVLVVLIGSFIGIMMINYAFLCSNCTRSPPGCWIVLTLTTILYTAILAVITVRFALELVLGAAVITLLISLVCLGLAYTSFDFTRFILIVGVAMLAVFAAFIFLFIFSLITGTKFTIIRLIYLVIMTLLSSVMLIIELQMILGGKTVELGEEDYAFGAFMVYTSIIHIFLNLIQTLGILDNL